MKGKIDSKSRVYIGMSGGVDSSVAALLLRDQGYDVIGVTIDTGFGDSPAAAANVCRDLAIEHRIVDLRDAFRGRIVDCFVQDYAAGLTPSPCLMCNPLIKFAVLIDQCENNGDHVATGHYVQKNYDESTGLYYLTCGCQAKDQSYFLALLFQDQISRCLFPLGMMSKDEVRQIAREHGLSSADKRDSFDVCFIPYGDYRAFLSKQGVQDRPGNIVDPSGQIVGRHSGLSNYTIGQRRGLDIALGYPAHVVKLDTVNNQLMVGPRELLYRSEAKLSGCVFQSVPVPHDELRCQVRVRHKALLSEATLIPDVMEKDGCFRLSFTKPEWGITPGQYAAFYDGDRLLGGGRFER